MIAGLTVALLALGTLLMILFARRRMSTFRFVLRCEWLGQYARARYLCGSGSVVGRAYYSAGPCSILGGRYDRRVLPSRLRRGQDVTPRRSARIAAALAALAVALVLVGVLVAGALPTGDDEMSRKPEPLTECPDVSTASGSNQPAGSLLLSQAELDRVAAVAAAAVKGGMPGDLAPTGDRSDVDFGPVSVVLRDEGLSVGESWADGETVLEAVWNAAEAALDDVDPGRRREDVDMVEIVLTHSFEEIDLAEDPSAAVPSNVHRGVRGLEITLAGQSTLINPTQMLATNRDFGQALGAALEDLQASLPELESGGTAREFDAEQVLVFLDDPPTAFRMERGNQCVPIEAVTHDAVLALVEGMSDWMVRAVQDDGRMTYKYWPSRGEESTANNMIRQWMATTALGRVAAWRDSDDVRQLTRKNIAYNLAHFFEQENGLGLIVEDGSKVKLGAVALAGRALVEHRDREDYAEFETALSRMVDHLWREDGSFKTWYLPEDTLGQENFYPGEALYFWSALYADSRDPELLDKFMRSFRYYREWHLDTANRNPAFIPWHTQAYYEVWRETGDPELAAFVFEMNDWLLDVQEWDEALYRDTKGRFYDPDRPFGPPHASSTGVYLEGLVDAYQLAQALGEAERAEAYRRAIVRGLRSVMQLQFADDVDMYYIAKKDRVHGAIRTEVYQNEIRVDNVQHNLMASLKILEAFSDEDFRP